MAKVAIIPGWAEGDWHIRGWHAALAAHNYQTVTNVARANIIVTHSSGCYLLPPGTKAQQYILINPSFWPRKSVVASSWQKVSRDFRHHRQSGLTSEWFCKTLWNLLYAMGGWLVLWRSLSGMRRRQLPEMYANLPAVTIVRNNNDPWCSPDIEKYVTGAKLTEMTGEHDDCWLCPARYISLLK